MDNEVKWFWIRGGTVVVVYYTMSSWKMQKIENWKLNQWSLSLTSIVSKTKLTSGEINVKSNATGYAKVEMLYTNWGSL